MLRYPSNLIRIICFDVQVFVVFEEYSWYFSNNLFGFSPDATVFIYYQDENEEKMNDSLHCVVLFLK